MKSRHHFKQGYEGSSFFYNISSVQSISITDADIIAENSSITLRNQGRQEELRGSSGLSSKTKYNIMLT